VYATSEVTVPADGVELEGTLAVPDEAVAIVVFAHGSGSSRHSPRNQSVAATLHQAGLGTLLFDLLDRDEELRDARTGALRFDIPLLSARLIAAIDWLTGDPRCAGNAIGCFGASTGAAAALVAAAQRPDHVRAVVSRGGRPDLAGDALPRVTAPTLLIVGGADTTVLELNREALRQMQAVAELKVVPGATHLFEEAGALQRVSELAREWFVRWLAER
jgi:putative phosphoribosyl transferase